MASVDWMQALAHDSGSESEAESSGLHGKASGSGQCDTGAGLQAAANARPMHPEDGADTVILVEEEYLDDFIKQAILTGSLGHLLQHGPLKRKVHARLKNGDYDLQGKVPFHMQMMELGADRKSLLVEFAHAGGLCDTSDGLLVKTREFIEIKSAGPKCRKSRAPAKTQRRSQAGEQYTMKKIRVEGTNWQRLIFVCRPKEPDDWFDPRSYHKAGFWLGTVSREDYLEALRKAKLSTSVIRDVTLTPGKTTGRYFLSKFVTWKRFSELDRAWCAQFTGAV